MNEPTMGSLVQRMERLEQENCRMKLAGVLVLLGIAAVIVMGQAKATKVAKVVEAEKFVVRDENGKERGSLEVLEDITALTLNDGREGQRHFYMPLKLLQEWSFVTITGGVSVYHWPLMTLGYTFMTAMVKDGYRLEPSSKRR